MCIRLIEWTENQSFFSRIVAMETKNGMINNFKKKLCVYYANEITRSKGNHIERIQ